VRSIHILLIYVFQLNCCKEIGDERKHENSFNVSTAYTKTHVIHYRSSEDQRETKLEAREQI